MKKVSDKQKVKDREIAKLKKLFPELCVICNKRPFRDAAHLVPKSMYPEHYTNPLNVVGMCRTCHEAYDNVLAERQKETVLIERVKSFDTCAANRYFDL